MRFGIQSLAVGVVMCLAGAGLRAEVPSAAPDFKEVYDLVAAHLGGMTPAELNRTAVQALLSALGSRVSLNGVETSTNEPLVSKTSLFDGGITYLRVARVDDGLAAALREGYGKSAGTNKINGLVLDLRYAGGMDYAAAGAAADVFLKKERPLLDWGAGMARSREKTDALGMPVAVLVNHQTAGSAEALAGVLRQTGIALVLGNRTAGQAMVAEEYPLREGGRLRIATSPVHLGDGAAMSPEGVKPDIGVAVSPEDERAYYADAFKDLGKPGLLAGTSFSTVGPVNGTNRTRRARFNEAELVRERKEGFNSDQEAVDAGNDTEKPAVRDPALARALDVLKGLAVVRQSRF